MADTDLQVAVEEPVQVITPSTCIHKETLYLHSIEQRLLFNIEICFIFPRKEPGVVELLRDSLSTLLVHYHFLAGRLRVNDELGRVELVCNSAGVPFAGAKANVSVSELLHHDHLTSSALKKLFLYVENVHSIPDIPLLTVQVTEFTCGGVAVSFCATHTALDGISLGKFFNDYASMARGEHVLSVVPNPDRTFMKARFPLQISHTHTGLAPLPCVPAKLLFHPPLYDPLSKPVPANKVFRLFNFTPTMIDSLKHKAVSESDGSLEFCSAFEVLTAHLWQARTRAMHVETEGGTEDIDTPSRLFMVVDVRRKLSSIPEGFVGNAITTAPCTNVPAEQVRNNSLAFCVKKVQQTIKLITEEYVRSELDFCELNQCILDLPGALLITTWCKLGYEDVDFGWGKPAYVVPLAHGMTEYVILFPNCRTDGGMDVFIGLEPEQMSRFEDYFLKV